MDSEMDDDEPERPPDPTARELRDLCACGHSRAAHAHCNGAALLCWAADCRCPSFRLQHGAR